MLGKALADRRRQPLNPRLQFLVPRLGCRLRNAVTRDQVSRNGQLSHGPMCTDVVETDLVECERRTVIVYPDDGGAAPP